VKKAKTFRDVEVWQKSHNLLSFAKIMELCFFLCYDALHETPWKPKRTGKTSATCHCVIEAGKHQLVGCGASSGSVQEFCLPMAASLSGIRVEGPAFKRDSWAPPQTLLRTEGPVGAGAACWSFGCRVPHGPLDSEADCRSNPQALRDHVSSQPCLEIIGGDELELSEARASRLAA